MAFPFNFGKDGAKDHHREEVASTMDVVSKNATAFMDTASKHVTESSTRASHKVRGSA